MAIISILFVVSLIVAGVVNAYLRRKYEEARKRERLSRRYLDAI